MTNWTLYFSLCLLLLVMVIVLLFLKGGTLGAIASLSLYWQEALTAFIGLEISAWVHLVLDGIFFERIGKVFTKQL